MLLALLFHGYATGVFSSRKLEQATYDSLAFRYIAANTHPDHDTIATFRKRFLRQLKPLFVQILLLARTMGFLNLGKISLDGSKIQANASKHSALSWGHATELEERLKAEVARLMEMAAATDAEVPEGMDIPAELWRREDRLAAIGEAKAKLEARAAERHAAEQAEYEAKRSKREARAKQQGRCPGGRGPQPPAPGVRNSDQINLTDEESRIMPAGGKSFQQAYNVQAGVDTESMLVVTESITTHANDKQEVEPTLKALEELPGPLGRAEAILADNGYYSEANVRACDAAGVTPYIAMGRDRHHLTVEQRWTEPPPGAPDAGPVDAMAHRLSSVDGRAIYAKRKSTVEPVFGIVKSVLGFRQFHLRGTRRGIRRMDAGQHGLESETALQSHSAVPSHSRSTLQRPILAGKPSGWTAAQARGSKITIPFDAFLANDLGNVQLSDRRCSTVIAKSDRLLERLG